MMVKFLVISTDATDIPLIMMYLNPIAARTNKMFVSCMHRKALVILSPLGPSGGSASSYSNPSSVWSESSIEVYSNCYLLVETFSSQSPASDRLSSGVISVSSKTPALISIKLIN